MPIRTRIRGAGALVLGITMLLAGGAVAHAAAKHPRGLPAHRSLPRITGTPAAGKVLHASRGRWVKAKKFTYEWKRCNLHAAKCKLIPRRRVKRGQRRPPANAYTLTTADIGHKIRVTVVASNAKGHASATSPPTTLVLRKVTTPAPGPISKPAPTPTPTPTPTPAPAAPGIHVVGNHLVTASGATIVLRGVDRAGTEYSCIHGVGIFDGPNATNDDAQVPLMKKWHVNSVFIGLNEDCWLGINGVKASYAGQNYINAIVHETKTLESAGIYPIVGLFWSAPGTTQATSQAAMPDNDHSPTFWQSVANTFKADPNVLFRLKEEPYPANNSDSAAAWQCWKNGDVQYGASGSLTPTSKTTNCSEGYPVVGMQSLVNIIRGAGAANVIQIPGVQYANSMTDFLVPAYRVTDTLSSPQLMADVDVYPETNVCGTVSCYNSKYAPVIAQMPFGAGEIGESATCSSAIPTTQVDALMQWFDQHGAGYDAWSWNTYGSCTQLITDYSTGNPTSPWGTDYKAHLTALQ